jgi:hypothetical protein
MKAGKTKHLSMIAVCTGSTCEKVEHKIRKGHQQFLARKADLSGYFLAGQDILMHTYPPPKREWFASGDAVRALSLICKGKERETRLLLLAQELTA